MLAKKVLSFRSLITTRAIFACKPSITFFSRSWVIGRGETTLSSCMAMALASKMPTQIGKTASPASFLRMMIGMLETGSIISPLIFISTVMSVFTPVHIVWNSRRRQYNYGRSFRSSVARTVRVVNGAVSGARELLSTVLGLPSKE